MSITANTQQAPRGATFTHKGAAVIGIVALLVAFFLLCVGVKINVSSASLWGYIGQVIAALAVPVALWGMSSQVRSTRLGKDGQPIVPMWNIPGSQWTYTDLDGTEIALTQVNQAGRNYTHITVWRSIRLSLVWASLVMSVLAGSIIVLTAYTYNLLAF